MKSRPEKSTRKERFRIDKLEERIAPSALANPAALPFNNDGTLNAAGHLTSGPPQALNGVNNWFGAAADRC